MSNVKSKIRANAKIVSNPSEHQDATRNRAGGIAFDINNPSIKLITMTGGSFFMEPRYYNVKACIPKRMQDGKFEKLQKRLEIVDKKYSSIVKLHDDTLDDITKEVISTIWDVLENDNPRDALAIAHWLRREMNIRLTPQVILVLASRHPHSQKFVREYAPKIVARADEIKTCIILHRYFFGMKSLKHCLAMGLSDAMSKFNEQALIKYEGNEWPSWKDILLTLPRKLGKPLAKPLQEYFMFGGSMVNGKRIIDRDNLPVCWARKQLTNLRYFNDDAKKLVLDSRANWEVVLSQFGQDNESKKKVWEYLVENDLIGYMALLRNIRNMLSADISMNAIKMVAERLSDKQRVLNSKQLPFRFASAYNILKPMDFYVTSNNNYDGKKVNIILEAIEDAADISCENVPALPGHTVVFADNSGSMNAPVSMNSKVTCSMAANMLAGIATKRSEDARICAFGTDVAEVNFTKNTHVLSFYRKISKAKTKGMATNTWRCAKWLVANKITPDRVIIFSDMQTWDSESYSRNEQSFCNEWNKFKKGSKNTWLHCVNLSGYGDSMIQENEDKVNLVGSFSEKILPMLLTTEGIMEDQLPSLEQIRQKW